ncbi:MAG: tetratricopeptide repeat protein, partial [Bacteroidota bacterium]
TTATDVYALGVVLYELLAGQRPYDVAGLSPSEVERTICDTAPTRPSAAIQAAERPVDRSLRGDLDTIVLKALAKEPGQRYATADALAADLRRYLAGEPVAAQPATAGYRARKFVARHRTSVTVAALLSLALLVGLGSVLWQGRIAALERDRAEAAADQATAVTAFLRSTLAAAKPREGQAVPPSELRIVDALRPAAAAAADAFPEQPEVRAAVLHTLGETYLELGLYDEAEAPLRAALALRDSFHLGPHPERIETLDALGLLGLWEPTITGADSFYLRSLDLRRQRYGQQSAEYAVGLARQTERLLEYGDPAEAVAVAEEAVGAALAAAGPRSEAMGEALFVLGTTRMRVERYAAADSALSALLNLALEITPPSDPRLGELHAVLGATRILRGQPERAEPVLRRVLDFRTARYDPGHPYLAEAQQLYAIVLAEEGRYGEAEQLLRTALPTLATGNPYSFSAPLAVAELAAVGAAQGRPVALDSLRAAVDALGESLGPEHAWTRRAAGHLAAVQRSP